MISNQPELSADERDLLREGLVQWGGPASLTEALAIAMGFAGVDDFFVQSNRLRGALENGEGLSNVDWTRALLATEIVFASDTIGAGVEWSTVTRFHDSETLVILRGLQRKLLDYRP